MDTYSPTPDLLRWLTYLENLHPVAIEMGLTRVSQVWDKVGMNPTCPIITIGGTNGKGSTATMLATILTEAGYRVGLYTSPHLLHYHERIRINMQPVSDQLLVHAFTHIDAVRNHISLTYFEFTTLAAMQIFLQEKVEVIVLEVGLGGRLDATNIFDPTVAAVVSVDIDHEAYLGDTREKIGLEKAGIFRSGKPALCADLHPPHSLIEYAQRIGAKLELYQQDFGYQERDDQWSFYHHTQRKHALPLPALRGKTQLTNASLVLAILNCLHDTLPVAISNIKAGLLNTVLMGRCQVLPGRPTVMLDVGHNPHAITVLRRNLDQMGFYPYTYAVFGMMQDKDIKQAIHIMQDRVEHWFIAAPNIARAASTPYLMEQFAQMGIQAYQVCESIAAAYQAAYFKASENDRILIFGSFYTVAEGLYARSA
jgi:dihydrofolate synthase/folylpolyglutamate synthase